MDYGEPTAAARDETGLRHGWQDFADDAPDEPSPTLAPAPDPSMFLGFGSLSEPAEDAGDDQDSASEDEAEPDEPGAVWAARMDRPWREIVEASRMDAEEEEEDTEAAIREALKAALEHPGDEGARTASSQEQSGRARHNDFRIEAGWNAFALAQPQVTAAHEPESDEEESGETEDADHPPFTIPGQIPSTMRSPRTKLRSD